jgi:hypothetical protein
MPFYLEITTTRPTTTTLFFSQSGAAATALIKNLPSNTASSPVASRSNLSADKLVSTDQFKWNTKLAYDKYLAENAEALSELNSARSAHNAANKIVRKERTFNVDKALF